MGGNEARRFTGCCPVVRRTRAKYELAADPTLPLPALARVFPRCAHLCPVVHWDHWGESSSLAIAALRSSTVTGQHLGSGVLPGRDPRGGDQPAGALASCRGCVTSTSKRPGADRRDVQRTGWRPPGSIVASASMRPGAERREQAPDTECHTESSCAPLCERCQSSPL